MVSIRLQRTGRRRQAQFRVVVQDSRFTPTSGRVIANLGFYNPHTKEHGVDLKKASVYLNNGAQPSLRMVRFFVDHKVDLPVWVKKPTQRLKEVKNPDKLRRNRSATDIQAESSTASASVVDATETAETAVEPVDTEETQNTEQVVADKGDSQVETEAKAKEETADGEENKVDEQPQAEEDSVDDNEEDDSASEKEQAQGGDNK